MQGKRKFKIGFNPLYVDKIIKNLDFRCQRIKVIFTFSWMVDPVTQMKEGINDLI